MKNKHAQAMGRLGGLASSSKLSKEQRIARSRLANEAKRKKAENRS